jgi:hypothetical protein
MDALANAVPFGRAYGWPVESVIPPAVVVGYPTTIDYDAVFGRGSDKLVIPVYFVCGIVSDFAARAEVSSVVGGANEIKAAIESDTALLAVCQTARVTDAIIEQVTIGGVLLLAVRFDTEVFT